jgi:lipoprotein-anchoring transpeptidase ErfK/SrfK
MQGGFFMRNLLALAVVVALTGLAGMALPQAAQASVIARVDLSQQRMEVVVDGVVVHQWDVSSGREGFSTPTGTWRPIRMHEMWYSRTYDNAPMPHAIFFQGGYAFHATSAIGRLGSRASHGCIRLHPDNARELFSLVRQYGPNRTRIQIVQ